MQLPRYRIERPIASGGFGDMLLATDLELSRTVALKVLHTDHLTDPEQVARFVQEAKVTAALDHPRIVRVFDHGVEDGVPWIAYEYVPGPTVRARMKGGALDWREAVRVAIEVADALDAAHERGIVHRDVKPENVLTGEDGGAKLADFGIARWRRSGGVKTATGLVLGTPVYLSPEQCRGEDPTAASDLYALGVMLFEMSNGKPPFFDENPLLLLRRHIDQPPPELGDAIPKSVRALVMQALAKKPEDRPASAKAMRTALEATLEAPRRRTHKEPVKTIASPVAAAPERGARGWVLGAAALALAAVFAIGLAAGRVTAPAPSPSAPATSLESRIVEAYDALPDASAHLPELRQAAAATPLATGPAAALALLDEKNPPDELPPPTNTTPEARDRAEAIFAVAPALLRARLIPTQQWLARDVGEDLPALGAIARLERGVRERLPRLVRRQVALQYLAHASRLNEKMMGIMKEVRRAARESKPDDADEYALWQRKLVEGLPERPALADAWSRQASMLPVMLALALDALPDLEEQAHLCRAIKHWFAHGHTLGCRDKLDLLTDALRALPEPLVDRPARWGLELALASWQQDDKAIARAGHRLLAVLPAECGTNEKPARVLPCLRFRLYVLADFLGSSSGKEWYNHAVGLEKLIDAQQDEICARLERDKSSLRKAISRLGKRSLWDASDELERQRGAP
jgi:hypothetical protein